MEKITNINGVDNTRIEELLCLFPEIESDGKINFDKLKALLGNDIDESDEKYEFTWPGKKEMLKNIDNKSRATLRPKEINDSQNLYIEGDNLEVLKILKENYQGKIKCIYIDPPYNTGSDLNYDDNFGMGIEQYKEFTKSGKLKNSELSGRKHSAWLNMMYPRLSLAQQLLTDDGVIFISIDDNEFTNLKKICDEIYGENNFIGDIIRKTKSTTGDASNGFNTQHENLFIYTRGGAKLIGNAKNLTGYKNPDNDPKGVWVSSDPSARTGYTYEIINPYTGKIDAPPANREWSFNEERCKEFIENGKVVFKKEHKPSERGFIFKRYANELRELTSQVDSLFANSNVYMNQAATKELLGLFDMKVFDYPKPTKFVRELIKYSTKPEDIILDFFSGSSTTAHAMLELNAQDNGNRKFICVQLPELYEDGDAAKSAGYNNICEIGQERIRRAAKKIKEENSDKEYINDIDLGFNILTLDDSNIKPFESFESSLDVEMIDQIKSDRSDLDVLYEMMFRHGIKFDIEYEHGSIGGCEFYNVGYGELVYVYKNITTENIDAIINSFKEMGITLDNAKFIFRESQIIGENRDSTKISIQKALQDSYNINYIRGI